MSKLISCDSNGVCTVNGMPVINQSDPRIAQSTYGKKTGADCYDASICSLIIAALANRDTSIKSTGRTFEFDHIPATNGIPKELNQLAWQEQTAGTAKGFYFSEVLADLGALYQSTPDPRVYSGGSTVLYTSDHGAVFRDWTSADTTHITDEYIIDLLNSDFAVMFGFHWTKLTVDANKNVTIQLIGTHKLVVSGCRSGAYPLRINNIYDSDQQWARLVRFDQATRPFGEAGTTGKSLTPASLASIPSRFYLEFENHVTPTDAVCVVAQIDAISLNWMPPQRTLNWHWGPGWTSFSPFVVNKIYYFLAYNSATGDTQLAKIVANGSQAVWNAKLPLGWTTLMSFTHQGNTHFLAYNAGSGAVQFYRVRDPHLGLDSMWTGVWGTGFTHFSPFNIDGAAHYIAYNTNTGLVHFDQIYPGLNGSFTRFEANWAAGWSTLISFIYEGYPHFIIYQTSKGTVQFNRIARQGALGGAKTGNDLFLDIRLAATWGTGWTHFVPIVWNGLTHFFAYKAQTGELQFNRVYKGAGGAGAIWSGKTSLGFTAINSFLIDGKPFILLYNQNSGEVAYFNASPL